MFAKASLLDLGLFVHGMTSTARAKFLNGEFFSLPLFVFASDVIPPFAAVAL
jgi:hypothetical protein